MLFLVWWRPLTSIPSALLGLAHEPVCIEEADDIMVEYRSGREGKKGNLLYPIFLETLSESRTFLLLGLGAIFADARLWIHGGLLVDSTCAFQSRLWRGRWR